MADAPSPKRENDTARASGRPIAVTMRALLGPTLPAARTLEDLCTCAGLVPTLLNEIVEGFKNTAARGQAEQDMRDATFERIREVRAWLPVQVQNVLATFQGHPQFDHVFKAVEEVRSSADSLWGLTYRRIDDPQDAKATSRWWECANLVDGAVDELRSLSGLRPVASAPHASPPTGRGGWATWLREVAGEVHSSIQDERTLDEFRRIVRDWRQEDRRRLEALTEWERRRYDHADKIANEPRLRDKAAGPPAPDWTFGTLARGRDDLNTWHKPVEGWIAPELSWERRPAHDRLLPLRNRPLELNEQYTVLAVVHDAVLSASAPINPWYRDLIAPLSPERLPAQIDGMGYHVLCDAVPGIADEREQQLKAILQDVRADLRKRLPVNEESPTPAVAKAAETKQSAASDKPPPKLPNLRPHDLKAYQLSLFHGQTQKKIAAALNKEYGTTYSQGHISRMIGRAKRHARASGLADLLPAAAKPAQSIDPKSLELGARTDHRTPAQREKRSPDDD